MGVLLTKKKAFFILHVVIGLCTVGFCTIGFARSGLTKETITFDLINQCESSTEQVTSFINKVGIDKFKELKRLSTNDHSLDWKRLTANPECASKKRARDLAHTPITKLPNARSSPGTTSKHFLADKQLQLTLDRLTQSDLTINQKLTLFQNGTAKTPILEIINHAKQFLFVNLLTLTCDEATEEVIQALEKKSYAGVDVRVNVNRTYAWLNWRCLNRLQSSGIAVHKSITHSSYYVNDQRELLLGSQSLARMFLLSDGFNGLDRDAMLFAQGPVATDAWRDFLDLWGPGHEKTSDSDLQKIVLDTLKQEIDNKERGLSNGSPTTPSNGLCRFVSQKPKGKSRALQQGLQYLSAHSKNKIIFSGVKFDFSQEKTPSPNASTLLNQLAERSLNGVNVSYIGNGLGGGNGELTMAFNELIANLTNSGWVTLARWIDKINQWDALRTVKSHFASYFEFLVDSKATVWTYFGFIHYKVWSFDDEALLVGSANLSDDSFNTNNETGLLCFDRKLIDEWNRIQALDFVNSTAYGAASFTASPPKQ